MMATIKQSVDFLKKAFIVIAVYYIVISLFAYTLNKDKAALTPDHSPILQNRKEIYSIINDKKLNSTKEGKLATALYRTAVCGMIGEGCTDNPQDGDKNYEKSAFGFITKLIVAPYANPPASGIYWAYSGLQNAGFIPKTYAAEGIGFASIKPFANVWKIFRDFTYMLLVIVLIGIGFMVMFRMKINAQTVISVESALPKIVISMILITFSFAIAGFMIDLMYVSIGIIVSILSSGNTNYNATTFTNEYMMGSALDLWGRDIPVRSPILSIGYTLGNSFLGLVPAQISALFRSLLGIVVIFVLNTPIYNHLVVPFASIFGLDLLQIAAESPGSIIKNLLVLPFALPIWSVIFLLAFYFLFPFVIYLLIIISILFTFFRIMMLLFTSYLNLLISIILGPLFMLLEAIPGKSTFKSWLIGIIGNLLAFPITIAIFVLAYVIVYNYPDLEFSARFPFLYGIDNASFKILVGMGLIFIIPDLVKVFREAIGYKPLPVSIGLGTYFGGVSTAVGGGTGLLGQFGSLWLGVTALGGFKNLILTGKLKEAAETTGGNLKTKPPPSGSDPGAGGPGGAS